MQDRQVGNTTEFRYLYPDPAARIFELSRNSKKMNISDVSSSLEHIPLPPDQKLAMLQLIDGKINNDMKEVIAEIRQLEKQIQHVHDKLSNEIKVVYWVVGIAWATVIIIIARK